MKLLRIFLALVITILLCAKSYAHPPSVIKIQFDPATQILKAVIEHQVSNPKTHYIGKVDIGLNGKEVQTLTFTSQKDRASQLVEIKMNGVKSGDILSVEGYCNLSGKLVEEIKVS
ncbi:MAG TPA: hypothetical protein PLO78_00240 [Candidatus Omnitrophota bacterium]|nr:hypothetical protein [Candidatus Omnitrophota bacterium]